MTYPPDFTFPAEKQVTAQVAAQCIAGLASGHRAVVQAGGCSGLWPIALAHYFARVYTFEPEPINFLCLEANVKATPNVSAFECALGDRSTSVGMTRPKVGAGLWRVEGEGDIPMHTIDHVLGDVAVDAIVLDIEGYEVQALRGAERVIERDRPVLWFEFLHHTADIETFLAEHGYTAPARGVGGDSYSIHHTRVQ